MRSHCKLGVGGGMSSMAGRLALGRSLSNRRSSSRKRRRSSSRKRRSSSKLRRSSSLILDSPTATLCWPCLLSPALKGPSRTEFKLEESAGRSALILVVPLLESDLNKSLPGSLLRDEDDNDVDDESDASVRVRCRFSCDGFGENCC